MLEIEARRGRHCRFGMVIAMPHLRRSHSITFVNPRPDGRGHLMPRLRRFQALALGKPALLRLLRALQFFEHILDIGHGEVLKGKALVLLRERELLLRLIDC